MTINIAVLGTGRIADVALVPALRKVPQARLWSVLSRDAARARSFAERHGAGAAQPAYTDLDALLADPELDAVIIASPDKLHAEQTLAAARAGKHVLTEKPMATQLADAEHMLTSCQQAGVTLAVAYHMRWHDGHRQLQADVSQGLIGTPRHMRIQWSWLAPDAANWRAGADLGQWWSLAGVGTHCLDQIRWFLRPFGGEIATLKSVINRAVWQGPHDETAVLALQFESGLTAELCSSVLFQAPTRMEIYGSAGYAICDGTLGGHGGGSIHTHKGNYPFEIVDPYAGEIADFVTAIKDQRAAEVDGQEGARNVALLCQAIEQAG